LISTWTLRVPLTGAAELDLLASKQPSTSLDGVLAQVRKSLGRPRPSKEEQLRLDIEEQRRLIEAALDDCGDD
jgi:hypothetical protein